MMTKLHICYIYVGDLGLAHARSLVGGSVSLRPLTQVSLLCRSSHGVLDTSEPLNPSSHSSTKLPELGLLFDCGSLHLSLSAAG